MTLGADATVAGYTTIGDATVAGAACDSAAAGVAIRHAAGSSIVREDPATVHGQIVSDSLGTTDLIEHVLDGKTIEEIAEMAHIKFGSAFGQPAFSGRPSQSAGDSRYRWGCPPQLISGCTPEQADDFPIVAIDAGGSEVEIAGAHGQGIIVVTNGSLEITGDFAFAGIVLSEGALRITGGPRLEGAVLAMDGATIGAADESSAPGHPVIRYNRCEIVNAVRSLTLQRLETAPQIVDTPTYAWLEVIR